MHTLKYRNQRTGIMKFLPRRNSLWFPLFNFRFLLRKKLRILSLTMVFSGCVIFTPRDDFEEPQGNPSIDPFNFNGILTGTGERFISNDPDEIFDPQMVYIDYNTGPGRRFFKNQFVGNLHKLKLNRDFTVAWNDSSPDYQVKYVDDSLYISKVKYSIIIKETGSGSTVYENGSSDFVLAGKTAWRVCQWRDIPDKVGEQSFFAPAGTE